MKISMLISVVAGLLAFLPLVFSGLFFIYSPASLLVFIFIIFAILTKVE